MGDKPLSDLDARARGIRRQIIEMMWISGGGHIGGSLSAVDLITVLYSAVLRVDPRNPTKSDRDRFILSKGHAAAALYAVLAETGFFPAERLFDSFISAGGMLQEHPDMAKTPGVDMSGGSLGQGLSVGLGMALAARMRGQAYRTYVLMGDGEIQEGQVWEAAMAASHYGVDGLTAILDYNGLQVDGDVDSLMAIEPLTDKWKAFGWWVQEIDGHDTAQIATSLLHAREVKGKPGIIVAHTVKGKGVSFLEGRYEWHAGGLTREQRDRAMKELE